MKITGTAFGAPGRLLNVRNDGTFVFRTFGDIDPATRRRNYTDHELRIDHLEIRIVQPQACFAEDEDGVKFLLDFPPKATGGPPP